MKKMLIGCAILALAVSCNKKDIEANTAERNEIENYRKGDVVSASALIEKYADLCGEKDERFAALYADFTEKRTQVFSFDTEKATTLVGDNGTSLIIPANNFLDERGRRISGEVNIELIEVFTKADMILLDKATNGITEDGEAVVALGSGGEIFVRATQEGRELDMIDPIKVEVTAGVGDPDMIKFVEADMVGDDLLWEAAKDERMDVEEEGDGKGDGKGGFSYGYDILPGEWGWTNIDKWYSDPCAKTTIHVEVPSGYDNTNTEVYLSYDGDPGRLANFDTWDGTRFTEHYGQICIGLDCHFIAVSNAGGSLEYAIHGATILNGHIEVFSSFTPITEADLITEINGLP